MIASVHVLVAVPAGMLDGPVTWIRSGDRISQVVHGAGVTGVEMAPLAEVGLLGNQHALVIRPVRVVAVDATLAHRCVLPQEGSAHFGMT